MYKSFFITKRLKRNEPLKHLKKNTLYHDTSVWNTRKHIPVAVLCSYGELYELNYISYLSSGTFKKIDISSFTAAEDSLLNGDKADDEMWVSCH